MTKSEGDIAARIADIVACSVTGATDIEIADQQSQMLRQHEPTMARDLSLLDDLSR